MENKLVQWCVTYVMELCTTGDDTEDFMLDMIRESVGGTNQEIQEQLTTMVFKYEDGE